MSTDSNDSDDLDSIQEEFDSIENELNLIHHTLSKINSKMTNFEKELFDFYKYPIEIVHEPLKQLDLIEPNKRYTVAEFLKRLNKYLVETGQVDLFTFDVIPDEKTKLAFNVTENRLPYLELLRNLPKLLREYKQS